MKEEIKTSLFALVEYGARNPDIANDALRITALNTLEDILDTFRSQNLSLLDRIEKEVIGEDKLPERPLIALDGASWEEYTTIEHRNALRAEQRTYLNTIKAEIEAPSSKEGE